jgi:hypothetical protein
MTISRSAVRCILVLLALLTTLTTPACTNKEEAAVLKVLEDFDRACFNADASKAISMLDAPSIQQYDRVIALARTTTREQLATMEPWDRYLIVGVRSELSPAELRIADGREYLRLAISRGFWRHGETEFKFDPRQHKVKVHSSYATIDTKSYDKRVPPYRTYLSKTADGTWKLDFSRSGETNNANIRLWAKEMFLTEDEVIEEWVFIDTGEPVPERAWEPLK